MADERIDQLLKTGVEQGASDIHFGPGSPPIYRIDGVMRPLEMDSLRPEHTAMIARYLITDPEVADHLDVLQDYDGAFSLPGTARFRVNVYRQRSSLAVALRVIHLGVPTFESLGLPSQISTIVDLPRGLILVTGATGSGKSSTMAATVDYLNERHPYHIISIEDPIEFLHPHKRAAVRQREIGTDTGGFATALRAAMRQDPDVVLVGEIRDYETMDIALKAAETGHLVLSTVHTPDCAKTLSRILAMFPRAEQDLAKQRLADNLKATISQRLLPRADGSGRVVACEIMLVTGTVREWLLEYDHPNTVRDLIANGQSEYGMQTFDQALTELFQRGDVTLDEAKKAATNPADFVRALHFV